MAKEYWTMRVRKDCAGQERFECVNRCATYKCAKSALRMYPGGRIYEVKNLDEEKGAR